MSATKILWGQILAVFALTLAGIWASTQWTAAALWTCNGFAPVTYLTMPPWLRMRAG